MFVQSGCLFHLTVCDHGKRFALAGFKGAFALLQALGWGGVGNVTTAVTAAAGLSRLRGRRHARVR
jgi:hypothetical protein